MLFCLPKLKTISSNIRSSVVTSIVSFFLLFTVTLGNVVSARATSGQVAASYSTSLTKIIDVKKEAIHNQESKMNFQKISNIVDVEVVASNHGSVHDKASKGTEKPAGKVAKKAYKRNRNNPKSLSNDLLELGGEAEHEVKQSWESLTGSMKGDRKLCCITLFTHDFKCINRQHFHFSHREWPIMPNPRPKLT